MTATRILGLANVVLAVLAAVAPIAHVLELPNKLALNGPLWLAVQQQLYRGWGPFLGGPTEIGALLTALVLLIVRRRNKRALRPTLAAALAYAAMLATFFLFNDPVNRAVGSWTAATLPVDWTSYRLRWESGHALAAVLSIIGMVAAFRGYLADCHARQPIWKGP